MNASFKNPKDTKSEKVSNFKNAVQLTPQIAAHIKDGLQALKPYVSKVTLANPWLCEGSVDIDTAVITSYPQANRWDYAFGYAGKIYYVEVHGASTSEVKVVIKKLIWLKDWINSDAPELKKLLPVSSFHWLQSGRCSILRGSSQERLAAINKIIPKSNLVLK